MRKQKAKQKATPWAECEVLPADLGGGPALLGEGIWSNPEPKGACGGGDVLFRKALSAAMKSGRVQGSVVQGSERMAGRIAEQGQQLMGTEQRSLHPELTAARGDARSSLQAQGRN